jgi:thiamine-monophosphate kinase
MSSISELGEFGLISRLTKNAKINNKSTIKGIGDDAAVIDYIDKQTVLTTDLLIEGIHFDLAYVPLKHLGYKSVVVNLSDVYAMNAVPKQITVSIAVSNRFTLEALDELYAGIHAACDTYGVDLVGGDTSSSVTGLIISITAAGEVEKDTIVFRNGAKPNDLICVSGDLGGAFAGLKLLQREKEVFKINPDMQPEFKGYDYILQRQLKPEARKDIIALFSDIKLKPSSMIDISDGLSSEILHLASQSGCGSRIFDERIPIARETETFAGELLMLPTVFAMNGGEDYELLFTISQSEIKKIEGNPLISIIGYMTEQSKGNYLEGKDGTEIKIEAQGWIHI